MITELEMTRLDIEGEAGAVLSMNHGTGLVSVELTRVQALHVKSYRSQQFSSVAGSGTQYVSPHYQGLS